MSDWRKTASRDKLVDELYDGLLGAIFGMSGVTFAVVGVIFYTIIGGWKLGLLANIIALVCACGVTALGLLAASQWHLAYWELGRRREAKQIREAFEERAKRPISTQPAIEFDPSAWTGRPNT